MLELTSFMDLHFTIEISVDFVQDDSNLPKPLVKVFNFMG
jgi:hypothetical protein